MALPAQLHASAALASYTVWRIAMQTRPDRNWRIYRKGVWPRPSRRGEVQQEGAQVQKKGSHLQGKGEVQQEGAQVQKKGSHLQKNCSKVQ